MTFFCHIDLQKTKPSWSVRKFSLIMMALSSNLFYDLFVFYFHFTIQSPPSSLSYQTTQITSLNLCPRTLNQSSNTQTPTTPHHSCSRCSRRALLCGVRALEIAVPLVHRRATHASSCHSCLHLLSLHIRARCALVSSHFVSVLVLPNIMSDNISNEDVSEIPHANNRGCHHSGSRHHWCNPPSSCCNFS
jgi:hypothetical protein